MSVSCSGEVSRHGCACGGATVGGTFECGFTLLSLAVVSWSPMGDLQPCVCECGGRGGGLPLLSSWLEV